MGEGSDGVVLYEVVNRVAVITMNRPAVLNARNPDMRKGLLDALARADTDQSVRALVLTGAGDRAFCTGLDLKESPPPSSINEARAARLALRDVEACAAVRKPTVAALHGYALGGGLELALACDLRIASTDASLGFPEVTRGLIPGSGGTQRLPRLIGPARALDLILTGRQVSAVEALAIGLVNQVVERAELLATALRIAGTIAQAGPLAVQYAKEAVWSGLGLSMQDGLALELGLSLLCTASADYAEGVKAFAERRPPVFEGR